MLHPTRPGPAAGVEDVDAAVKAARKAFDEGPWARMGGKVRCHSLARASGRLRIAWLE